VPTDFALLDRIERHVCDVAARSRDTVAVGPFDAFFSEGSDDYLLSLAVPRATPVDWAPALRALDEAFAARDRRTRLEFGAAGGRVLPRRPCARDGPCA